MANLIGQRLGQYEIVNLLGEGGMAAVYRAHQLSMKRDVAIKVIKPGLIQMGEFVKRFEREAQTVASLNHPHILKVFDYGQHEELVYLVMELQPGGSLAELIRGGPLPLDLVSQVLGQVAAALDYAHERGIIHRDLKPQNVLLDEKRNAILTDFGIAKIVNDTAALTQSGMAIGTPAYMSPEQWQGRSLDGRTDIYALGVMLFEMLSGRLPFDSDTAASLMYMHLNETPPSIQELRPDLPANVESVLNKALAKDVAHRFSSAGELAAAFRESRGEAKTVVAGRERPARPDTPTIAERPASNDATIGRKPPDGQKKRPVWPLLAVGIGLLAVLAVVLVLSSRGRGTDEAQAAASAISTQAVAVVPTTGTPDLQSHATATIPTAPQAILTTNTMESLSATPNAKQTLDAMRPGTTTAVAAIPSPQALTSTPIPFPISGVNITFHDDFGADRLSNAWNSFGIPPAARDGMLIFTGQNRWTDGIMRFPIREDDGLLLLFQYEPGASLVISLDSGDYSKDSFRQWRVGGSSEAWTSDSASGVNAATSATYGKTAAMRPGVWYFLLFRVGENSHFDAQLWERDNPSAYVLDISVVPSGDNWNKREWAFVIHPYSGVLKADAYWEMHFPAGYKLPDTPPVALTSALMASS